MLCLGVNDMCREMKDSGIAWLGQVPKKWTITRMKSCILRRDSGAWGNEPQNNENDIICLRIADFDYKKYRFKEASIDKLTVRNYSNEVIEKLILSNGDILIEKSGGGEKTPVGRTVIFDKSYKALYANFCDRIRCRDIVLPDYMQYVLVAFYQNKYVWNYIKQTTGIQNLDLTTMFSVEKVALPSLEEQNRIVTFLSKKCANIDTVTEQTEDSIRNYKKMKQALIVRSVTNGLQNKRTIKDSGVEWIGEIPEEWHVYRIANLYQERSESGLEDLPILTVSINTGVSDREIADEEKDRVFVRSEDRTKYKRVYPGDLVYNMMRAWQGAFGAVRVEGMVSPAYVVAKPKDGIEIDSRYMEALLRTSEATEEMHRYSRGIVDFRLRLYWPEFKNIRICLPPIEEQREIADYIDKKNEEIDRLIKKKEQFISELENYRKSLIYEYVTGKKEVPES